MCSPLIELFLVDKSNLFVIAATLLMAEGRYTFVVYFDQQTGAPHIIRWSK